jgi:hypothetical protein
MTSRLPGHSDASTRAHRALGLVVLALAGAGLVFTNPSPADFQFFAAERLVDEISEELCGEGGLPVLMGLAIRNCQELVQAQRGPLAAVVARHTRRRNLGFMSLYRSEVGGQSLLLWRVPRFRSTVVAVAGQFVLISAATVRSDPDSAQTLP